MPKTVRKKAEGKENVTFTLEGEDALAFRDFKEKEIIGTNAIAGKKLMLERLRQWQSQRPQEAGTV